MCKTPLNFTRSEVSPSKEYREKLLFSFPAISLALTAVLLLGVGHYCKDNSVVILQRVSATFALFSVICGCAYFYFAFLQKKEN